MAGAVASKEEERPTAAVLMERLRAEVAEVMRAPPAWLHNITQPKFEEAVLYRHTRPGEDEDDEHGGRIVLERCEDLAGREDVIVEADDDHENRGGIENSVEWEKPVSVDASISGGSKEYAEVYRFRITRYPGELQPRIRTLSIIYHLLINDDTREPSAVLFSPENAPKRPQSLGGVLEALYTLLTKPPELPETMFLGAGKEEEEKRRARFQEQWQQYAKHNGERERVIRTWRNMTTNAALVEPSLSLDRSWFASELAGVMSMLSPSTTSSDAETRTTAALRDAVQTLVTELAPGVYTFPFLSQDFCKVLIEESEDYAKSGLPQPRPNSMNNYGLVVNSIGMEHLIHRMQVEILQPLSSALYPIEGSNFDGHHSFLVRYKAGEDRGLDMHTDDSDITFNVCLGKAFTGAGLTVCGMSGSESIRQVSLTYPHRIGHCIVHRGRQRHGADDIETGERINLIVWNHNSMWRQTDDYRRIRFVDETTAPDPRCMSFTHDRDFVDYAAQDHLERVQKQGLIEKGWYPPAGVKVPQRSG